MQSGVQLRSHCGLNDSDFGEFNFIVQVIPHDHHEDPEHAVGGNDDVEKEGETQVCFFILSDVIWQHAPSCIFLWSLYLMVYGLS